MPDISWNEKAEYLARTRSLYLNDDYLEFLVRDVWRLEAKTDVVDFGCGFGYMGLKLLPLLPDGSTYTGLDTATSLLEKGREAFSGSPYQTQFIEADAATVDLDGKMHDVAICHALMLHVTDPVAVLRRMRECVKPRGLVVCIEPHHIGAMTGYYHGGRQSDYVNLGILQSLYEKNAEQSGRDGNIGIKLPLYMEQAGLTDIQCRLSDRVNVLLPGQNNAQKAKMRDSFLWEGLGAAPKDSAEAFRQRLVAKGLTAEQADLQYAAECRTAERYAHDDLEVVWACAMMITFGRIPA